MASRKASKEKVVEASITLFNAQGFSGTSVRDIARKAGCNVALISYYFGSKQGLLEELITSFLEGYVQKIENQVIRAERKEDTAYDCLLNAIWGVMVFQKQNNHLARFVHREITIDTILVRELMATYLAKEKHLILSLLEIGYNNNEMSTIASEYFVMQLRGMLTMPFLHPQYIREVYHLMPHENQFLDNYFSEIASWIRMHFKDDITVNKTV